MVLSKRCGLRAQYQYAGEREGLRLVHWLNQNQRETFAQPVLRLFEEVRELGRAKGRSPAALSPDDLKSPRPERIQAVERFHRRIDGINEQLGGYTVTLEVLDVSAGRIGWGISGEGDDSAVINEIFVILRLAETGLLGRVRRCKKCARWLFARFSSQRSCSAKCRQLLYRSTPKYKADQRAYMRKYRKGRREQDKPQFQLARKVKPSITDLGFPV